MQRNSHITPGEIAVMLGTTEEAVKEEIKQLENDKIILGYRTLINWEQVDEDTIKAYIELKITPQAAKGFDRVAEKIYKYPQVKSLTLMSGSYDLLLEVEGETLRDVAMFVSEKLSQMDSVIATTTHFVLKTYKKENVIFQHPDTDPREVITL